MKFLERSCRLPEQCGKRPFVNFGRVSDFNMLYILPLALKQSLRILQARPVKEAELHIARIRVDIRDGPLSADPAPVSPLHSFAQPGFNAFHKLPQRTDDRLVLWALSLKVIIEARICLHPCHYRLLIGDAIGSLPWARLPLPLCRA